MRVQSPSPLPLTPKEQKVLSFIVSYQLEFGYSPTYQEICRHFQLASYNSVQNYLKQLQNKNYLQTTSNGKRSILVVRDAEGNDFHLPTQRQKTVNPADSALLLQRPSGDSPVLPSLNIDLPLLGMVAAGQPLESLAHNEIFSVPLSMVKNANRSYVLRVKGESMIDEGILDGDFLLVEEASHAHNGALVVAKIDDEATVKRIHFHTGSREVELRPSNSTMKSIWVAADRVQVKGIVSGLIRKY